MKLNLGCGGYPILGWRNMDAGSFPGVESRDLTRGFPDIPSNSVDAIFTEHFLEHLTHADGIFLLSECHRVLKPGGVMRICVPDLAHLVDKYIRRDVFWGGPGGWEPKTPCRMVNEGMTSWGHQFMYDFEELATSARAAGFETIYTVQVGESSFPDLCGIDRRTSPHDLRVELIK